MKKKDVEHLKEVWERGTWNDGAPVDITVEWLLYFKLERLIEILEKLIE